MLSCYLAVGRMRAFFRHCWMWMATFLLLAGCSDSIDKLDVKPAGARMTPREVLHLAHIVSEQQGINLRHFNEPECSYESVRPRTWQVFFGSKSTRDWKPFFVYIEDQTREARFIEMP